MSVRFEFAQGSGDQGFREELELQLLSELRRAGCFRSVAMEPRDETAEYGDERLRLRIVVNDVFEQTTRDVSTAERTAPHPDPTLELAYTALIRAQIEARLEYPAGDRELRGRRVKANISRRPRGFADDARDAARTEALVELARETRVFVCRGGAAKLSKELGR